MDNNATNFTYPGSTAPAVTPPTSSNGQSGQFSHVAPPVSPVLVDDGTQAPTLTQILQAENTAAAEQSLQQQLTTQTPFIGDISDGSVPVAATNQVVADQVNSEIAPAEPAEKSALASLAEKLNSFKASLIEEIPEAATPAPENEMSSTVAAPVDSLVTPVSDLSFPAMVDAADNTLVDNSQYQDPLTPVEPEVKAEELPTTWSADMSIPAADNTFDPAQNVNPVMYSESPAPAVSDSGFAPIIPNAQVNENVMAPVDMSATPTPFEPTPMVSPTQYIETPVAQTASNDEVYPFTIYQLLDIVIERNASDLHLTVGYPASIRVDGSLIPVSEMRLTHEMIELMIGEVLPEAKKELLEVNREVDLAYSHGGLARFRINAFFQQQTLAAAFRLIPTRIKTVDELQLPQIYHQLTKLRQGFVLVTGPTGSGKSTTLAAILQEINQTRSDHLITVEDPIEYIFPKGKAVVNQRELHEDTHSWEIAMKSALRQDPDVVLVGEMRDYETVSAAITLAETGHLVFATLHTNSCSQTIDRIIDVFPEHQQSQVRSQLSNVLEAVVAQRLIPLDKGGRKAVSEIMIATAAVRNLIREGKTHQLDNVIRTSADIGMVSLEHSLVKLVRDGLITIDKAQEYAVRPEEVVRLLKG